MEKCMPNFHGKMHAKFSWKIWRGMKIQWRQWRKTKNSLEQGFKGNK
jgi:hypothetical protein